MKKHLKDVVDLKNHLNQFDWREDEKSDNLITNDFELSYEPKLTIVTEAGAKFYGLMPSVQVREIETNEIFYRWDTSTIAECSIFLKWYEEIRTKANRRNSDLRSHNRSLALDKFFNNQSERSDY